MRKYIVAGNWKMNNDLSQTEALIAKLKEQVQTSDAEVMIAPSFVNLQNAIKELQSNTIEVVSQNMHFAENGAYTGEVSASMLKRIRPAPQGRAHRIRKRSNHVTIVLNTKDNTQSK